MVSFQYKWILIWELTSGQACASENHIKLWENSVFLLNQYKVLMSHFVFLSFEKLAWTMILCYSLRNILRSPVYIKKKNIGTIKSFYVVESLFIRKPEVLPSVSTKCWKPLHPSIKWTLCSHLTLWQTCLHAILKWWRRKHGDVNASFAWHAIILFLNGWILWDL